MDKNYDKYVKKVTPTTSTVKNVINAYIVGGVICIYGEALADAFMMAGIGKKNSAICAMLVLIATAVLLTGLGIYYKLAKFGGAGALVPITGFANSVAAPAIEYKKEGQVFGVGVKIFTIAGPVILYGIVVSWALGLVYWILKLWGIM